MAHSEYRHALAVAIREYEARLAERHRLDGRLGVLAQTIGTLSRLCGLSPTVPWGLTDACRTVLRNAGAAMTPLAIRDRLESIGYDFSGYSNALAALHTTLNRLAEAGELSTVVTPGSGRSFLWRKPPDAAALTVNNARIARDVRRSQARRKANR